MVIEFISLLLTMTALKGMTGALAPFSYLVLKILIEATGHPNVESNLCCFQDVIRGPLHTVGIY